MTNPASNSVSRIPRRRRAVAGRIMSDPEEKARRRKAWNRIMDAVQELIAESDEPGGALLLLGDVGAGVLGFELARQGAPADAAVVARKIEALHRAFWSPPWRRRRKAL